jgi:predicted Zn finger-like uncharacterized protein
MIIKCEKCQTRFRLDDSKITEKGVKVRCTKCKEIFRVHKEELETKSVDPSLQFVAFSDEELIPPSEDNQEPAAVDDISSAGGEIDFQDDFNMFGASVESVPEPSKETISFEFEGDSFSEPVDAGGQDTADKVDIAYSPDTSGDVSFNLGEIDFGDEQTTVAAPQVSQVDLKPSQEILFAPPAEIQDKAKENELTVSFFQEEPAELEKDLPPLSITSRRKQNPLFTGIIAVVLLLVIAVLGYLGLTSQSTSKEAVVTEGGKIGVRAVKATYIENAEAGVLLVISGEAFNEYPKPRAALQVKVTLFDGTGQSVVTKSAYCGNPLTEEQLKNLQVEKIEAVMANQFGDSLANMEVAPGKAIPFVVVIANLPKGAKDFSVESAGSTVATGKQQ